MDKVLGIVFVIGLSAIIIVNVKDIVKKAKERKKKNGTENNDPKND